MTDQGNYILWLPLWYPNRTDPFSGDFIQRHARAAASFWDIEVLIAIRDLSLAPGEVEERQVKTGRLSETIIYYNTSASISGIFDRGKSFGKYRRILSARIQKLFEERGLPFALHAHVFGKNCWVAYQLSNKTKIPLLYSEHRTGFLKESSDYMFGSFSLSRFLLRKFIRQVSHSTFVSEHLASSAFSVIGPVKYSIIPNVVDDSFFKPDGTSGKNGKTNFIHISTLGYQKNFDAILKAFSLLAEKNKDFELRVFGPVTETIRLQVLQLGLRKIILFEGEQPHDKILPVLQSADALILYSRYETFGCVVIESNACGVPVIVSDIPVMHELVRQGENGLIVKENNPEQLASLLLAFTRNPLRPDKNTLHQNTAEQYGVEKIGSMFNDLYTSLYSNKS